MKVYLLTEADFDLLVTMIMRDPDHGDSGHGSMHRSDAERQYFREAHRFYNYQVCRWLDQVKQDKERP